MKNILAVICVLTSIISTDIYAQTSHPTFKGPIENWVLLFPSRRSMLDGFSSKESCTLAAKRIVSVIDEFRPWGGDTAFRCIKIEK